MITTVGMNSDYKVVIQSLLTLEQDAMAAYEEAIQRLDEPAYKNQLQEFLQDHQRHVQELQTVARTYAIAITEGGDLKRILTQGKVVLADMLGDEAILRAMKTNEDDTVTAYERATHHATMPEEAKPIMQRALQDEIRHRAWMIETAEQINRRHSAA